MAARNSCYLCSVVIVFSTIIAVLVASGLVLLLCWLLEK
jgi:hypothetical protein